MRGKKETKETINKFVHSKIIFIVQSDNLKRICDKYMENWASKHGKSPIKKTEAQEKRDNGDMKQSKDER